MSFCVCFRHYSYATIQFRYPFSFDFPLWTVLSRSHIYKQIVTCLGHNPIWPDPYYMVHLRFFVNIPSSQKNLCTTDITYDPTVGQQCFKNNIRRPYRLGAFNRFMSKITFLISSWEEHWLIFHFPFPLCRKEVSKSFSFDGTWGHEEQNTLLN